MKQLLSFINEAGRKSKTDREVIKDPHIKKEFGDIELIDPEKDLGKEDKQSKNQSNENQTKDE